jgi:ribosomal protein S18 acetylase RimI-like enzyme
MRARDWREEDEAGLASLYAAERERWRATLSWETGTTWHGVEEGRRLGTVTGATACDGDGRPAGWCFALLERDQLQVGGFVAQSEAATTSLLEWLEASPAGRAAHRWLWFGWFDAPGLAAAMAARGGAPVRYVYLVRPLCPSSVRPSGDSTAWVRGWQAADLQSVAPLLASAYGSTEAARAFAPTGRLEEWRRYVASLVSAEGCGVFDPQLSVVASASQGGLAAIAMMSRIAPGTAHLVQLAVRADVQGRGMGRAVLAHAIARAAASGCSEMTLLVHEHNQAARQMYAGAGFVERAAFLSATWAAGQPCTSSSEALPTGGVSTRR